LIILWPGELLLDHLVGQREQVRRDVESDRLGGLHQLVFRRLYDRKIGPLGSHKNLPDIHADLAKCVGEVRSVADEFPRPPGVHSPSILQIRRPRHSPKAIVPLGYGSAWASSMISFLRRTLPNELKFSATITNAPGPPMTLLR
jgi:hypothetical protein